MTAGPVLARPCGRTGLAGRARNVRRPSDRHTDGPDDPKDFRGLDGRGNRGRVFHRAERSGRGVPAVGWWIGGSGWAVGVAGGTRPGPSGRRRSG